MDRSVPKRNELSPEQIRTIRMKGLGWTTKQMGEYMGVTANTVRTWELPTDSSNHRKPGPSALVLLCKLRREVFKNAQRFEQVDREALGLDEEN